MRVDLEIDGKRITAEAGQTILQVAQANGVRIPTLCYHKDLTPSGNCRMCVVEIHGSRTLQAACVTPTAKDMVVLTDSRRVREDRKRTLGMMLANHTANCSYCDISNECELQDLVYEYQVDAPAWGIKGTRYIVDTDPNPYIHVDLNKCVLCRRCIQACAEIQVRDVWGVGFRGFGSQLVAGAGTSLEDAGCEWCGQCIAYCPTGALSSKVDYARAITKAHQVRHVTTTCSHCSVGCQLDLIVRRNRIVGVRSNPASPVNGMALCVRGRFDYATVHHEDRLRAPRVRRYLLDGTTKRTSGASWDWVETDWKTALQVAACGLAQTVHDHGGSAVGLMGSGRLLNEENYLLNKLARQVIGTHSIDSLGRRDHADIASGLAACLGAGETTNSMREALGQARAIFVIGSNTTAQHPVFATFIRRAVRFTSAKLIIADPAEIGLSDLASLHLHQQPGSDTLLLNGLLYVILEKGWEDRRFIDERTEGFERLRESVDAFPPTRVSQLTGIPINQLYEAAEILGTQRPALAVCGKGLAKNGDGFRAAIHLANLQLALGNFGIPGGGIIALQGQNNIQGACDMGAVPYAFTGNQPVSDQDVAARFATAWGMQPGPAEAGLSGSEMLGAASDGALRALYILGEDPVTASSDDARAHQALASLDFLVVQDILPTETASHADVVLPGVSFAEKTGTFTNTERRIQMVRQAIPPVGEARPDWWIITNIANRLLKELARRPSEAAFSRWNYADTTEIMAEIAALTPDYAGVTHSRVSDCAGIQWPCRDQDDPGTAILHTTAFAGGRASFVPAEQLPPPEPEVAALATG